MTEAFEKTAQMATRLMGERIKVQTTFESAPCRAHVAPGQVDQLLMNLMVNARDAMPEGGELTVSTKRVELGAELASMNPRVHAGRYLRLTVADTGVGMDTETKMHIFEPFFPTKPEGKGTGLGLATVFGIVQGMGGAIFVHSDVGCGTTFEIYIPVVDATLTEDEAPESLVLSASHPAAAMAVAARFQGKIDLLVTDVTMPTMSGRALADKLLESRPDRKVLYMSGFTDDVVLRDGSRVGDIAFLQKPIAPNTLRKKLRRVLTMPAHVGA